MMRFFGFDAASPTTANRDFLHISPQTSAWGCLSQGYGVAAYTGLMLKTTLFFCLLTASAASQATNLCAGLASYPVQPLIGGKAFDLCKLDTKTAKAVLLVNTASQCGFTPQYEGLEKLHQRFKAQGLMVVGIPANDFGSQEKGSNKEIAQFCQMNFGVSFTVGSKLETPIGKDPLFAKLAAVSGKAPGWNFHKYLINAKGQVQSFDSAIEPLSAPLVAAVQTVLKP